MNEDRTERILKRVAQTLGVSEDVLRKDAFQHRDAAFQATSQELELLRLFLAISDPKIRQSCLEYVRAAAVPADMAAG
ncbi:hypothetical protein MKK84_16555 [Methylobacterium sp. E-065]|uniref:hypothetical protein n=1 Tax=Methylobacterium sp. E-065 TaxID=2836583 RepID=UPI001FB8FF7B|nr:hypothetical protein [Methylobacterium sp. E-065]MCJ2019035.1 hypothetical protein [Methylobacterium sp. E-065]